MKASSIITLLLCVSKVTLGQSGHHTLEVDRKFSFSNLLQIGEKIKTFDITLPDSVLRGCLYFPQVSISKLKDCNLHIFTLRHRVHWYVLSAKGSKNILKLKKQLIGEMGDPVRIEKNTEETIYRWKSIEFGSGLSYSELIVCNEEAEFRKWPVK